MAVTTNHQPLPSYNHPSVSGPNLQGKATKGYTLQISDSSLFLFTSGIPEHPVAVVRQRNGKRETYWYGSYDDVPFDGKLFEKPPGKIEDRGTQVILSLSLRCAIVLTTSDSTTMFKPPHTTTATRNVIKVGSIRVPIPK